MDLINEFRTKAQATKKHLVLPEGLDERMIHASVQMTSQVDGR